jgi:hypothetical protein
MRLRSKHIFVLLLAIAAVSAHPGSAQTSRPAPDKPLRSELAIDFSYARSNEPPGGCACFNLNGVSGTFASSVKPGHFALAADITIVHAGSISSTGESLTLSAFTAGVRYLPLVQKRARSALRSGACGSGSLIWHGGRGQQSRISQRQRGLRRKHRRRTRPQSQPPLRNPPDCSRLPANRR